jgi:hypothetical protein
VSHHLRVDSGWKRVVQGRSGLRRGGEVCGEVMGGRRGTGREARVHTFERGRSLGRERPGCDAAEYGRGLLEDIASMFLVM